MIEWNKVTWYSKLLAIILGVAIFFVGFYFGNEYGELGARSKMTPPSFSGKGTSTPTEQPKENTTVVTSKASSRGALTTLDLVNASYSVWAGSEKITLGHGHYENDKDKIISQIDSLSIGDVDHDGVLDALVSIVTSRGDSTEELFLVKKSGGTITTRQLHLPEGEVRSVLSIVIAPSGVISIEASILGENDPHCCPSLNGTFKYRFESGVMVMAE